MVEGGGGPAFPVIFFDGEREMNIGDVRISPTLEYKPFQLMLSQKIGISPNQISIYLIDRRKGGKEERRRTPITVKVNFALICRQKDCCFLVVLKRSRKSRYRRDRIVGGGGGGVEFGDFVPENLILLRRENQHQTAPFYDEIASLSDRLRRLSVEKENYEVAMGKGNYGYSPSGVWTPHHLDDTSALMMTNSDDSDEFEKVFCEDCERERRSNGGPTTSFHHCVNDAVVATRFVTRWGPIGRVTKTATNKPFR